MAFDQKHHCESGTSVVHASWLGWGDITLQAVSRRWVERAAQFVTDELIHLADGVSTQNTVQSAARLQLPTHTAFHERAEALAPLLQVAAQHLKSILSLGPQDIRITVLA